MLGAFVPLITIQTVIEVCAGLNTFGYFPYYHGGHNFLGFGNIGFGSGNFGGLGYHNLIPNLAPTLAPASAPTVGPIYSPYGGYVGGGDCQTYDPVLQQNWSPIFSPFRGSGNGRLKVGGDLPVCGSSALAGQVPVVGTVQFSGTIPASGTVVITGTCSCGCSLPGIYY
uniref:Chorion early A n=1 Tax=Bombyx mori TaxID=7091 RepID=H9JJD1_BOMMO|nr:chorion class CA protein ERA.3-like [Bombyx mori]BAS21460.1 chorion early A [Bombyx mori]